MAVASKELVFCFDVGQGAANLIQYAPDHFAIVDLGPKSDSSPVEIALRKATEGGYGDTVVATLVISHVHGDHWQGWRALVEELSQRADNGDVVDRPFKELRHVVIPYHQSVDELLDDPREEMQDFIQFLLGLTKVWKDCKLSTRVIPVSGTRTVLELSDDKAKLSLVHPTRSAAERAADPNGMSGIVVFESGLSGEKFVFAGDAPLSAWHDVMRRTADRREPFPWEVKLFAVPHHGGRIWPGRKSDSESDVDYFTRVERQLDTLFTTYLRVENAYISVGSNNSYRHPHALVVDALKKANARVLCSQITPACMACGTVAADLETIRTVTLHGTKMLSAHESALVDGLDTLPGLSSNATVPTKGHPKHVGCASTVVAVVTAEGTKVLRSDAHSVVVDALHGSVAVAAPRCRMDTATRT